MTMVTLSLVALPKSISPSFNVSRTAVYINRHKHYKLFNWLELVDSKTCIIIYRLSMVLLLHTFRTTFIDTPPPAPSAHFFLLLTPQYSKSIDRMKTKLSPPTALVCLDLTTTLEKSHLFLFISPPLFFFFPFFFSLITYLFFTFTT